jgi:hypothetical protein
MVVLRKPQAFGWVRTWLVAGLLTTVTASGGCQTATGTGAAAGGAIGAGVGGILSHCPGGALFGGLVGAGAGALGGAAVDASREKKAQRAASAQAADAVARAPSLEDIRNMTQSAVPPAEIVGQIRASGVVYRLTPDQIIWLNRQGVDQSVITALQDTALRPPPGRMVYTAAPVVVEQPVYMAPPVAVGVGFGGYGGGWSGGCYH